MALPTEHRIRRTREFTAVRTQGQSWSSRCLILATRPRPDLGQAHAGFTTTKRLGNAVVRNKIRRRLRMIVRGFHPKLKVTHDIVTIAKFPAVKAEYEQLRREWEHLARRAGLFTEAPPAAGPPLSPPPPA